MSILIRLEEESDFEEVEHLTREAFWDVYRPGCNEHVIVHKIRKVSAFVKDLSYVACENDRIVGNIIYSKARIEQNENLSHEVLCMGPLGVLPEYQKNGIGSELMKVTLSKARDLGYKAVIIFGNPKYYNRFGFINAKEYSIQTSTGANFDAFMALELQKDALKNISGRFFEDKVFDIEDVELEEFEKRFPYKEKHVTDTQLK